VAQGFPEGFCPSILQMSQMRAVLIAMVIASASSEFCKSILYTDSFVCEDGTDVDKSSGCCAATKECPTSCMSSGWGMADGVKTCTCKECNFGQKLKLGTDDQYLKATNYFRCRHGQKLLVWDKTVAGNAKSWADTCPAQGSNPAHIRPDGSNSYKNTPRSGENIAAGQGSPEKAVEAWYSEITDPGYTSGKTSSGTGRYTALIWASSTKLGCALNKCASGSPKPVHVCHYAASAPNMPGSYEANVPTSNKPTATEATCCATVYLDWPYTCTGSDFTLQCKDGSDGREPCKDESVPRCCAGKTCVDASGGAKKPVVEPTKPEVKKVTSYTCKIVCAELQSKECPVDSPFRCKDGTSIDKDCDMMIGKSIRTDGSSAQVSTKKSCKDGSAPRCCAGETCKDALARVQLPIQSNYPYMCSGRKTLRCNDGTPTPGRTVLGCKDESKPQCCQGEVCSKALGGPPLEVGSAEWNKEACKNRACQDKGGPCNQWNTGTQFIDSCKAVGRNTRGSECKDGTKWNKTTPCKDKSEPQCCGRGGYARCDAEIKKPSGEPNKDTEKTDTEKGGVEGKKTTTQKPTPPPKSVMKGSLTLTVPNATAFLTDTVAKNAVKAGIASFLGVQDSEVTLIVSMVGGRRLAGTGTGTAGDLKVDYIVIAESTKIASAKAKMTAATDLTALSAAVSTKIVAAKGSSFAVVVKSKTAVIVTIATTTAAPEASPGAQITAATAAPQQFFGTVMTMLTASALMRW